MDDVVALCKRVLVIHHGRLLYDGALTGLSDRMAPYKRIVATLRDGSGGVDLAVFGQVASRDEGRVTLHVPRELAVERTAALVQALGDRIEDISVEDPPIEDVDDRVFSANQDLGPGSASTAPSCSRSSSSLR